MKVLAILFLVAIVISNVSAVRRPITQSQINRIENLRKNKNTWTSIAIEFALLKAQTGGPLDELLNALNEVINDLTRKLNEAHSSFDRRTNEHNTEVRRLNDAINKANSDIAATTETINEILVPTRDQLKIDIASTEKLLTELAAHLKDLHQTREREAKDYALKVEEHHGAIEAIDECLKILETLKNGGASFAQIKQGKNSMTKVLSKLKILKGTELSFIQALVSLATNEFANQDALQKVVDKFAEVRQNLLNSLALSKENEDAAIIAYHENVKATESSLAENTQRLETKKTELANTEEQIEQAKIFIEQRTADRQSLQDTLEAENAQYEVDTNNYNDLVAQFNIELGACQEALSVLEGAEFADYISNRMDMDVVIDQGHGSQFKDSQIGKADISQ